MDPKNHQGFIGAFQRIYKPEMFSTGASNTAPRYDHVSSNNNRKRPRREFEDIVAPKKVAKKSKPYPKHGQKRPEIESSQINTILDEFSLCPKVKKLATTKDMIEKVFAAAFQSFNVDCQDVENMDHDLAKIFVEIKDMTKSVDSLFPAFFAHACKVYPHLECYADLKSICDLTSPEKWYPHARMIKRKFIFHAGPANSGKTHDALLRFKESSSGIYLCPLRLLASEVFQKVNKWGTGCNLHTDQQIIETPGAKHTSCTVDMLQTDIYYRCAIIDEIQMLRDEKRGWAWTRALLGVAADEVHLCGEAAAVSLVQRLLKETGETVEVRHLRAKTVVKPSASALESYSNIQESDCIICACQKDIVNVAKEIRRSMPFFAFSVIYGDLPATVKDQQATAFNNPNHKNKVLIATDAVGMGINLNIKRIIFNSITMWNGEQIPAHSLQQVAGRAARFRTSYKDGEVLALNRQEHKVMKRLFHKTIPDIEKAGITPTVDHLENLKDRYPDIESFTKLLDIFASLCKTSDDFFLCSEEEIREWAELIDHHPFSIKEFHTFCTIPVGVGKNWSVSNALRKVIDQYAKNKAIELDFIHDLVKAWIKPAQNFRELTALNDAYEVVRGCGWLSHRFPNAFPPIEKVKKLEEVIEQFSRGASNNVPKYIHVSSNKNRKRPRRQFEDIVAPKKVAKITKPHAKHGQKRPEIESAQINTILDEFSACPKVKELVAAKDMTVKMFAVTFQSFNADCQDVENMDYDLAKIFVEIKDKAKPIDNLFPAFFEYACKVYPHLPYYPEMIGICDLSSPELWYPQARQFKRKFIFHAGPANSGKTYDALQRFKESNCGIYLCPLRLLASEVFDKVNQSGNGCNLRTGQEIIETPGAKHTSCTVEMLQTDIYYRCAIIDEIQLLRDEKRGWAWTRALLGVAADEVHLCGESAAVSLVQRLLEGTGETVEVRTCRAKNVVKPSALPLGSYSNLQEADCIICARKKDIIKVANEIRYSIPNMPFSVIYGDLPPAVKDRQANYFNNHENKILIATDAVGMGINLNIKRIIFNSITMWNREHIPAHSLQQVAGRAARFNSRYKEGEVLALNRQEHAVLTSLFHKTIPNIEKAGITPTVEHLEKLKDRYPDIESFTKLLDIFASLCKTSDDFFLCSEEEIREWAVLIDHYPFSIKEFHTFCTIPVRVGRKAVSDALLQVIDLYAKNKAIELAFVHNLVKNWIKPAQTFTELTALNDAYEVVRGCVWLSHRFPNAFPSIKMMRNLEEVIEKLITENMSYAIFCA
ncbi:ATP-dependent RNA helicase SUV3 like protein, mitochondrial [Ditylenchus destructor]|nr:ATP-dependent RNA helicase SUV3 like protein, mitochondrial [Ditylenchus destructor]